MQALSLFQMLFYPFELYHCLVPPLFLIGNINVINALDPNVVISKMQYFGVLKEIINVDYQSFNVLIFDVQWLKVLMMGSNAIIHRDISRFIVVNSSTLE